MNRQQRRNVDREKERLQKKVNKLDPNTTKLVDTLAEQRFDNYVKMFKELLSDATFEAMRDNRVGEDRANRILMRINEIMHEKSEGKA